MNWRTDWEGLRSTREDRAFVEAEEAKHNIAANVYRLRKNRDWTQGQLAEAAAMSQPTVSLIETADQNVQVETLGKLAAALEVSVLGLMAANEERDVEARIPEESVAYLGGLWEIGNSYSVVASGRPTSNLDQPHVVRLKCAEWAMARVDPPADREQRPTTTVS